MINVSEFSKRELEELDPIFKRSRDCGSVRERNYQVGALLRHQCDRMKVDLYDYLKFKARQEIELEQSKQEPERTCIVCEKVLSGKQEKYCSPKCRNQFYEKKKEQ